MHKILIIVAIILIVATGVSQGENEKPELIKVIPAYMETNKINGPSAEVGDPYYAPPPRPRDQMYVFWILGKVLSYPVDQVEQYVSQKIRRISLKPKPKPAAPVVNPFDSVDLKEIPPAPPVTEAKPGGN